MSLDHLNELERRLSAERQRMANASTTGERNYRAVWVKQLEKEVAREREFLGVPDLSDDELLMALGI